MFLVSGMVALLLIIFMKSNIFVWNCQEARNPKFYRILNEYLREFNPELVVLVETKVSGVIAENVIRSIGLPFSHRVEAKQFSGGIWVLWNNSVEMVVKKNHFQFVYLKVKFAGMHEWVLFTGIYGSPRSTCRREL